MCFLQKKVKVKKGICLIGGVCKGRDFFKNTVKEAQRELVKLRDGRIAFGLAEFAEPIEKARGVDLMVCNQLLELFALR
jgi:hypothetical protein